MHKHAADFGRLVSPPQPALDARVGAPGRTRATQHRRQVAGAKANERIVRVQCRDHHFTHFTVLHRVTGAGPHDLDNHIFIQDQSLSGRSLIGDRAQISGCITLITCNAALGKPVPQGWRKGLTAKHGFLDARQCHTHLMRLVDNDFQKARCPNIARRLQFAHGLHLLLCLAGTARENGATERVGAGFHHGASGHKVVAEAVVNQFTWTKTRRKHGARHAPIVFGRSFRLINRARAGKHARHPLAKADRAEAAKHIAAAAGPAGLLARQQFMLARDGQRRQGRPTGHRGRVDVLQNLMKGGRRIPGMGHLSRQCRHQGSFTRRVVARFQRIVMFNHVSSCKAPTATGSTHGSHRFQASQRLRRL